MDQIIIGVDTHKSSHIAVAINTHGARLGTMTIPTTRQGYRSLEAWATGFGPVKAFGIEGTGSYGGLSVILCAGSVSFIRPRTYRRIGWRIGFWPRTTRAAVASMLRPLD